MVRRIKPAEARMKALATGALTDWRRALNNMMPAARVAVDAFTPRPDLHPPAVLRGVPGLAMDSVTQGSVAWAGAIIQQTFSEGLQFLGYPYLAELAQRPEYRVISQTIAEEMTRKWGKFEAKGDNQRESDSEEDDEDPTEERQERVATAKTEEKAERIDQLTKMFNELHVREECKLLVEQDGFFGRSHLYLDTGDTDDRDELRLSIGSGKDNLSHAKVSPEKPLKRLKCVEAVWCYPTNYESTDPLKPSWYNPEHWFVMGKEVHTSRLLLMISNPVPDMLKPAYSFGGLSMSQLAQPYVNNWLQTRQSVNDLIQAFVVWGLKTNLAETLSLQGEQLFARLDLFNRLRNNRGVMVLDKETEEFFNVTAALSGLESLQAQAQEHMAAVSRIPLVKLLGIQPTGLNASSEGEIRVFYDTIHGRQEWLLTPIVTRLMHFCMLSLWGEIDEDITWSWNPLWALDEKGAAEVEEIRARTAQIWIDTGTIDKMEERRRIANAADGPYPGLDPDFEPDLAEELEEGLVPEGGGAGAAALKEGGGAKHPDNEGQEPEAEVEGGEGKLPSPLEEDEKRLNGGQLGKTLGALKKSSA